MVSGVGGEGLGGGEWGRGKRGWAVVSGVGGRGAGRW